MKSAAGSDGPRFRENHRCDRSIISERNKICELEGDFGAIGSCTSSSKKSQSSSLPKTEPFSQQEMHLRIRS